MPKDLDDLTAPRAVLSMLPAWQEQLIEQILNAMTDYYCLPDKFEARKALLKEALVNACTAINKDLLKDASNNPPPSPEIYKNFVDQINAVLHDFDPHLELAYNPEFIAEMRATGKIISGKHAAKFDFSGGPPKEEIEKWNRYEQENPTTGNFGFIDYQGPAGVIPDNIGYVNISHLLDPQFGAGEVEDKYRMGPNALKRLHEVMAGFQGKEGIILDLSVTPYGGSLEMVQHIVSFFVPDGAPLATIHDNANSG